MFATASSTVSSGSFLLAAPLAVLAGLVSFASPCVLPLVPGYLSFLAGGAAVENKHSKPRTVLGSLAFVAGFTVVFVSFGALFGGLGQAMRSHERILSIIFGLLTIALGVFFAGWLPRSQFLSREVRLHWVPRATILGAFALGFMFALGWTPCIGPALGSILGLAASSQGTTALRGSALAVAYCFGLGIPFVLAALATDRFSVVSRFIRRHAKLMMVGGGVLLIAIGVAEVTGLWSHWIIWLQDHFSGSSVPL